MIDAEWVLKPRAAAIRDYSMTMPLSVALQRPLTALLFVLLAGALLAAPPGSPARAQQEGSGSVVIGFLTALDAGDIDAAMATWVSRPEVELSTGERYDTPEAVRAYLESFPRPIEIVDTLPWGGHRFEARVLADGTPLLLTFEGGMGSIAYLYVEPDPGLEGSG